MARTPPTAIATAGAWALYRRGLAQSHRGETNDALRVIHRFYGRPGVGPNSHFFTGDLAETFELLVGRLSAQWFLELADAFEVYMPDVATGACHSGWISVYRLWNARVDSNHRYTTDPAIKVQMLARGHIAEGYGPDSVALCAVAPQL